MNRRHLRPGLLAVALVASFAAAFWVQGREDDSADVVAAAPRQPERRPEAAPVSDAALPLDRLTRRSLADTDTDPFRPKNWYVAPPPPPPLPPAKPTAPPLPFQYAGKFQDADGGNLVVYLAKGAESFAVKPGDKFDNAAYQFEGIERGQVVIVYLPLSLKQRLPIGTSE